MRQKGKEGCKAAFPIAGLSAGMLAQYSGRILQKGCRKKLPRTTVQEREKEGIYLPTPSCLLSLGQGLLYRARSPELPGVPLGCRAATQEINVTPPGVAISFKSGSGMWLEWMRH